MTTNAAVSSRGDALVRSLKSRWLAIPEEERPLVVVLSAMIAAGVVLRLYDFGFPADWRFDEEPFTRNAQNYLMRVADDNDHPPLGKLLMAVGILLFGYDSVGWRFTSLCFGIQTIVIGYHLARALFPGGRAGLFCAAVIAADGFFLSYSRTSLLDGTLTCLVLWSVLAAVVAKNVRGVLVSVVLVGLATSVKWSGAFAVFPAACAILLLGRAPRPAVLCFALVPAVHFAVWTFGLALTRQPADPAAVAGVMVGLFKHHVEMGKLDNPLASPWYTWPLAYHPIVVKYTTYGIRERYASSMGNPVFWVLATSSVLVIPVLSAISRVSPRVKSWWSGLVGEDFVRPALIAALGYFALLAPWMVGRGKYTFWYHYLPSYGFGLLLVSAVIDRIHRRKPQIAVAIIGLACVAFVFFAPVWAEFPLSVSRANLRLVFKPWRP